MLSVNFKNYKILLVILVFDFCICGLKAVCPLWCVCSEDFKIVNCNNKHLTDIPEDIPVEVEKLYLNNNNFTTIPNLVFQHLAALSVLEMKHCRIVHIAPKALNGLINLKTLDLQANNVYILENEVFYNLTALEKLILSQNHLTEIPNAIVFLEKLKTLILTANKISTVSLPLGFEKLVYFSHLNLNNNSLKKIMFNSFDRLHNLHFKTLLLSHCELTEIEVGSFSKFFYLQSLSISSNNLNISMVENILNDLRESKDLQSLNLSNLNFSKILLNTTFQHIGSSLYHLFLSNNSISQIQDGTFLSLSHLQSLDLSFNNLEDHYTNYLTMIRLKNLNLKHNILVEVPNSLPPNLQILDLSFNLIYKLSVNTFSMLWNLKELNLMHNKISELDSLVFQNLNNLKMLDLSFNKISFFGSHLFGSLKKLNKLNLNSNNISQISLIKDPFGLLYDLTFLDIGNNKVSEIDGGTFQDLYNLKNLTLKNNNMSTIPSTLFSDENKLIFFDLSMNSISTISISSMTSLHDLKWLNLSENPFACTCELLWLSDWMKNQTNLTFLDLNDYLCHSPSEWQNKKLLLFLNASIDCTPHQTTQNLLLLIAVPICSFILISVVIFLSYHFKLTKKISDLKSKLLKSDEENLI